jgi:hypothetical protein
MPERLTNLRLNSAMSRPMPHIMAHARHIITGLLLR